MKETTTIRTIKLENDKIKKALEKKKEIGGKGYDLSMEAEDLKKRIAAIEEEVRVLLMKSNKEQDKVLMEADAIIKPQLEEDEAYNRIFLNENGEIEVEIFNMYQEYKKIYENKNAEQATTTK